MESNKINRPRRSHAIKNDSFFSNHKKLSFYLLLFLILAIIIIVGVLLFINLTTPKQMTADEIKATFYGPEVEIDSDEIPDTFDFAASDPDLKFDNTKPVYVLFHGYGDNSEGMVDLVKRITQNDSNSNTTQSNSDTTQSNSDATQWISLNAPFEIDQAKYGIAGNAWYFPAVPDNPGEGSTHLTQKVAQKVVKFLNSKISSNRNLVSVGFSQGGLMASEVVRSEPDIFSAAISFSGQVDLSDFGFDNQDNKEMLSKTPIFYAYSNSDEIIPANFFDNGAKKLSDSMMLTKKEYDNDEHSIQEQEILDVKEFVKTIKTGKNLSIVINGDLLFHPGLWNQYRSGDSFDFTELFAGISPYLKSADIAICDMETPIAPDGGPYIGYPVFAIPPHVIDYAAKAGWNTCTTSTNHAIDGDVAGVERIIDRLDSNKIYHTGSYKSEADANKPLIIPTSQGKFALIGCTVSLNGSVADTDWRVDRCRDNEPDFTNDIDHMISKAKTARNQGANVVAAQLHSVQEYIDYADSWQQKTAHALADSGAFDLIYAHGSHSVQPVELYNGVWIIYGVGNVVTESAPSERAVNNDGITYKITFSSQPSQNSDSSNSQSTSKDSSDNPSHKWIITDIAWVASANAQGSKNKWCSLASDHPQGVCRSSSQDEVSRDRIDRVIHSMGVQSSILHEWLITK